MTNKQKVNKHQRTKSNKKTTTAGPRGRKKRLKHGKYKNILRKLKK